MAKGVNNIGKKTNNEPLIDKIKAIYLYQLGPNSSFVDTEYQEYFSNQTSRYIIYKPFKYKQE